MFMKCPTVRDKLRHEVGSQEVLEIWLTGILDLDNRRMNDSSCIYRLEKVYLN
jgi:hypothetical protein